MNRLLLRQIQKHLPADLSGRADLQPFLAALDAAYDEFQQNQTLAEHTLEVVSEELTEANQRLRHENEDRLAALDRHHRQTLELQQGMILCFER